MKNPYVIAETAYSFEGSKQYLLDSINSVPDEVNAIKFHLLFDMDEYMVSHYTVLRDLLEKWLLSAEDWVSILEHAKSKGKDVIILADDIATVDFLTNNLDLVDGIEVHAACVNDVAILDKALSFAQEYHKRFYLGISGFVFDELKKIIAHIKRYKDVDILLMYGFQNYPTKLENLQMNKISFYRNVFDCPIGYADHTQADLEIKDDIICAAYSSGVDVLEIHYTNGFCEKRTDAITAYDPEHLRKLCDKLKKIQTGFGEFEIKLNEGELNYLNFRKVPVYSKKLPKGHVISEMDIVFKRVEKPKKIHQFKETDHILGKRLNKDVDFEAEIVEEDFE